MPLQYSPDRWINARGLAEEQDRLNDDRNEAVKMKARRPALFRTSRTAAAFCLLLVGLLPPAHALHPISSTTPIPDHYPRYPTIDYATGARAAAIRRGEYLAKIGDCIACHTAPDDTAEPFSGGLPIKTPFGTFYSPNITPDAETGIGGWSEQDFIRLMHEGIRADGSNAFPALPYVYFNKVTLPDLKDLWAYMQAVPPVHRKNLGNTLPPVVDWRIWQSAWKLMFFNPGRGEFEADPDRSASWNRGAYLVNGLGHCSMCHTPMNLLGASKNKYFLTGSFIDGFWAPDITGAGLATASRFQVTDVFLDGRLINAAGPVRGPMADANHDSLGYLTAADRLAIADYLKSVASRQPRSLPPAHSAHTVLQLGQQVYANVCDICHLNGEAGAPRIGDAADWSDRAGRHGLNALYRHAINGFNKMPPRGACVTCSDADVIAGVDYLLYHSLQSSRWKQLKNPARNTHTPRLPAESGGIVYNENCAVCHENGRLGAPRTGDAEAWRPIIRLGVDRMIMNTLEGMNNMPPRGGCRHCSGAEIIAAVKYMLQRSSNQRDYSLW